MASIQKSISNAAAQLRDMTLSQRVAIALGIVLVAGSLAWLGQWAAAPEMTPLLHQDLSAEDLSQVRSGLDALGQPYRIQGSRILVPTSASRTALLAHLQQSEKLPSDTSAGFAALVREANPWISQEENNRRWTVAMKAELERVLRQMAGVRQAHVFLNLNNRDRGFSREQSAGTASVTITMRTDEPVPRALALAAARLVSGAVRGLPLRNVEVVDGSGRVALDWDAEGEESTTGLYRLRAQQERETERKIHRLLDFDPKVRVKVQVVLNHTSRRMDSSEPIEGVTVSESTTETTTNRGRAGGQPGVEPNVGLVAGGGGSEELSRSETRDAQFQPGMTTTSQATPAGDVKQVFAAISLSHSYLAGVLRRQQPDLEDPTEEQLQQVFERQRARLVGQVSKLVLPPEPEQVAIDWYYDMIDDDPQPAEAAGMAASLELARRWGPASALALLALLSMGVMLRMARSTATGEAFGVEIGLPKEAIEAARRDADQAREAAQRVASAAAVPTGDAVDGVLEAPELDGGVVEVNAMLKQVSQAVESDADGVAALVGSWMNEK